MGICFLLSERGLSSAHFHLVHFLSIHCLQIYGLRERCMKQIEERFGIEAVALP